MTYEIKTDVPLPNIDKSKYPFRSMNVGDCFDVPRDLSSKYKTQIAVSNAAVMFKKKNPGINFTVRIVDDVVRCWRIS